MERATFSLPGRSGQLPASAWSSLPRHAALPKLPTPPVHNYLGSGITSPSKPTFRTKGCTQGLTTPKRRSKGSFLLASCFQNSQRAPGVGVLSLHRSQEV